MARCIYQILHHRHIVALFSVAMLFGVQANVAMAGCGDYLHVKGQAPKPMNSVHSETTASVALQDHKQSSHPLPVDTPCQRGNCRDGQPHVPPIAPASTLDFDVEDPGMTGCGFHSDAGSQEQRFGLSNARLPSRLAVVIDRPPG